MMNVTTASSSMMKITTVTTTGITTFEDLLDVERFISSSTTSTGEEKLPADTLVTAWTCNGNTYSNVIIMPAVYLYV